MNSWIEQWFRADQAQTGGVIRRKREDVDKYASLGEVIQEARRLEWHVIETGNQVVVLCHTGAVLIHC